MPVAVEDKIIKATTKAIRDLIQYGKYDDSGSLIEDVLGDRTVEEQLIQVKTDAEIAKIRRTFTVRLLEIFHNDPMGPAIQEGFQSGRWTENLSTLTRIWLTGKIKCGDCGSETLVVNFARPTVAAIGHIISIYIETGNIEEDLITMATIECAQCSHSRTLRVWYAP